MKKQETVNTFSDGLILDLNPLTVPNTALTNCLNGTYLTYNGNENMLQNDMGNARVETAMLPSGYIPIGSTSFGGIIYIVSYNPIKKECQIGSFPSPERNLSKEEIGKGDTAKIDFNEFCSKNEWKDEQKDEVAQFGSPDNVITNYYQKVNLLENGIHSGDKYKVFSNNINDYYSYISGWYEYTNKDGVKEINTDPNKYPKYLKFEIVSTLDNGKIINLTNNSIWTPSNSSNSSNSEQTHHDNPYYIYNGNIDNSTGELSLPEYRGLVGSNYDTYNSKLSGKLGLVARLEVPTSFSVGYHVLTKPEDNFTKYTFYFLLNWSNDNIGVHKNRVNPSKVNINVPFKIPELVTPKLRIGAESNQPESPTSILHYNEDKEIQLGRPSSSNEEETEETKKSVPNTLDDVDYYAIDFPEDYYTNPSKYIFNGENKFSKEYRKNDGTDFQYILEGFSVYRKGDTFYVLDKAKKKHPLVDKNIDIDITPLMPFGKLEFLKRTLKLDLAKINTGSMALNNYQYYVEPDKINIDFSVEAYPNEGESIKDLSIVLQPLSDAIADDPESIWLKQSTYDDEITESVDISKAEKVIVGTPTGLQHIEIDKNSLKLKDNKIYLIHFIFGYSSGETVKNRIFSRLLFNNTLFNNAFGEGKDFKDLYLYEKDEEGNDRNYGLKIILNSTEDTTTTYRQVASTDISKYNNVPIIKKESKEYQVSNSIDSDLAITSNLEDGISLDITSVSLLSNQATIKDIEQSDDSLVIKRDNNPSVNIKDGKFTLNSTFRVKVPYTIDYSKVKVLKEYKKSEVKEGTTKIFMRNRTKAKEEGWFATFISPISNDFQRDGIKTEFECPNESKNIKFYLDYLEPQLRKRLNEDKCDYLTVLFGSTYMDDNNCGYGYRQLGTHVSEYFYKLGQKPHNSFTKITCVRRGEEAILIHKKDLKLRKLTGDKNETQGFNYFMRGNPSDGTLVSSEFTKYKKTGASKSLYYIGNIDYAKNPSVNMVYKADFSMNNPSIKIGDNINVPQGGETVTNLLIKDLQNFSLEIPINTVINNEEWTNQFLVLSPDEDGWDVDNNIVIPNSDLYKVYNKDGNIVKDLAVNDNGFVTVSEEFINNSLPTEWYFGWEDTKGSNNKVISRSDFENSRQYYSINYTYASPELAIEEAPSDPIWYDVNPTVDIDTFYKGTTYELTVFRGAEIPNMPATTLEILCVGGECEEFKLIDSNPESFEAKIYITPTEETCEVTLFKGLDMVGEYTFYDVKDPPKSEESTENGNIRT